jgi:hypothetical protein
VQFANPQSVQATCALGNIVCVRPLGDKTTEQVVPRQTNDNRSSTFQLLITWKLNGQVLSFVQMQGLSQEWLSATFWFPAYNNIALDGQVRFGVP